MIAVRLQEDPRTFEVRVGDKLVGRVIVYSGSGRIMAEIKDNTQNRGYRYLEGGFRTLKQATNRLLRADGYGNCKSVEVTRCAGFKSQ